MVEAARKSIAADRQSNAKMYGRNWFTSFLVTFLRIEEQVVWCIRCSFVALNWSSLYNQNSKRDANICNARATAILYLYCCRMNSARVCRIRSRTNSCVRCSSSYCNAVAASFLFAHNIPMKIENENIFICGETGGALCMGLGTSHARALFGNFKTKNGKYTEKPIEESWQYRTRPHEFHIALTLTSCSCIQNRWLKLQEMRSLLTFIASIDVTSRLNEKWNAKYVCQRKMSRRLFFVGELPCAAVLLWGRDDWIWEIWEWATQKEWACAVHIARVMHECTFAVATWPPPPPPTMMMI